MSEAETRFAAENGMTPEDAWGFILRWREEGKIDQVQRGCQEILRFFPDHQGAAGILAEIQLPAEAAQAPEATEVPEQQPVQQEKSSNSLLGKIRATVQEQRHKFQEMSPKSAPSSDVSQKIPGITLPNDSEKLLGALSYFWIFVIVPLLIKRDSQFVQFHAWQGLVLTGGFLLISVLFKIITGPFRFGTGSGTLGFFAMFDFVRLVLAVVIYAWAIYNAYSGKWVRIPVVYNFSERLRTAINK